MRCKKCNARIADHDIWCVNCGTMTDAVNQELSAIKSFNQTWQNMSGKTSANASSAGFAVLLGLIPMIILSWLFQGLLHYEHSGAFGYIVYQIIKAVAYSLFLPFLLVVFRVLAHSDDYHVHIRNYLAAIKAYPRYFGLSLMTTMYYVLIYIICFGLPGLASDPILRLVWIVLVNYWVVLMIPVPLLMEKQNVGIISALKLSYRHFHDLRWNIYLLILVLIVINGLALVLAVVGLIFTIPLSWFAIRDYIQRLIDFELLSYRR
ncbi:MAG: hypothetical protein PHI68_08875 [Candidatus Cloacimonetes bacterium]|nr:hypothetical protein [Candidatus Cloacimonadota bacterium]